MLVSGCRDGGYFLLLEWGNVFIVFRLSLVLILVNSSDKIRFLCSLYRLYIIAHTFGNNQSIIALSSKQQIDSYTPESSHTSPA